MVQATEQYLKAQEKALATALAQVQELEKELAQEKLKVSELQMALDSVHSKTYWKE